MRLPASFERSSIVNPFSSSDWPIDHAAGAIVGENTIFFTWCPPSEVLQNETVCALNIASPRTQWPKLAMKMSAQRFSLPFEAAALCGVTMTFGMFQIGES